MILIAKDDAYHVAHLLQFLTLGEVLAFDCAKKQATLCQYTPHKKFLRRQAKQEYFHASVFKMGIQLIKPKGLGAPIGKKPMQQYRQLIEEALNRGDLSESILGMQIILEGLGDIALEKTNMNVLHSGATFDKLRRIVLGQEDAHHTFGLRYFESMNTKKEGIPDYLKNRADDYVHIVNEILSSVSSLFEYFEEDSKEYQQELIMNLPHWSKR